MAFLPQSRFVAFQIVYAVNQQKSIGMQQNGVAASSGMRSIVFIRYFQSDGIFESGERSARDSEETYGAAIVQRIGIFCCKSAERR